MQNGGGGGGPRQSEYGQTGGFQGFQGFGGPGGGFRVHYEGDMDGGDPFEYLGYLGTCLAGKDSLHLGGNRLMCKVKRRLL